MAAKELNDTVVQGLRALSLTQTSPITITYRTSIHPAACLGHVVAVFSWHIQQTVTATNLPCAADPIVRES